MKKRTTKKDLGFFFEIPTFGKFCGIVYFGVCEDWREMGGVWDCIDCIAECIDVMRELLFECV